MPIATKRVVGGVDAFGAGFEVVIGDTARVDHLTLHLLQFAQEHGFHPILQWVETLVELGQARVHLIEPLRQGRVRFAQLVDAAQYPSGDRAAARGDHGDQDRCPYGYRSGHQVMAFFPFVS